MKTAALLALLFCLGGAAPPHDEDTPLLLKAARCLAAKDFLPRVKGARLAFGYMLDERSYPGEKLLYVAAYTNNSRRQGFVFTVFLTSKGHNSVFNIQNNARFIQRFPATRGVHRASFGRGMDATAPRIRDLAN